MTQKGYISDLLNRFGMSESKPVEIPLDLGVKLRKNEEETRKDRSLPYRELGVLTYLAVCTRPDIAYVVSYLSQYYNCYDLSHWSAAKRVFRYLKDAKNDGLLFKRTTDSLIGFVDADWANCVNDRRSYTGYAFILAGSPITWEFRKQRTIALSSTEAEYMALSEATKEAVHLQNFLTELGLEDVGKIKLFSDNCGALKPAENPVFHNRTKHIDVRYLRKWNIRKWPHRSGLQVNRGHGSRHFNKRIIKTQT